MGGGTSSVLVLVLATVAAALCVCVHGGPDMVADSCDAIRDFVDAGFCASRLRSVPGAASADRRGHLLAAADLAAAAGASAARESSAAAASGKERDNPAARDALEACGILYGAGSVPALRLLHGYAARESWAAARALLPLTGHAGIACEAALHGSPDAAERMAAANLEFDQLTTMATALLNAVA